jgi:hypothetical protein
MVGGVPEEKNMAHGRYVVSCPATGDQVDPASVETHTLGVPLERAPTNILDVPAEVLGPVVSKIIQAIPSGSELMPGFHWQLSKNQC